MANEIQISGSLSINKPSIVNSPRGLSFPSLIFSMIGGALVEQAGFGVATTTTALSLGGVASPGLGAFMNNDTVNTITLMAGSASFASLAPGQPALIPLYPGITLNALSRPNASTGLDFLIGSI